MPTEKELLDALRKVNDPELGKNIVELGMVRDLKFEDGIVKFTLTLTIPGCPMRQQMANDARAALKTVQGVRDVEIAFGQMTDEERKALFQNVGPKMPVLNEFNKVKKVIAVMSGKGGVGKSSVTALLASALRQRGLEVGILDADITGPSIPKLFGLPTGGAREGVLGILPTYSSSGIRVMSTNLLLSEEDMPIVWRGPLISKAITQFWRDTLWGILDFMLVDLPPGTSDAALTVMQSLPLDGVILVTTPQGLSSMVVRKAVHLAQKLETPILGLVENMSYFCCPDCGKEHEIFGPSHAEEIGTSSGVSEWLRLPIIADLAVKCDAGRVEDIELPEIQKFAAELTDQFVEAD
ncbi:MAG: Mrp/NBP35 family ATP-binding protein [Anaerolineaceae bacterium]|nr:Mrp/NBP35 family ATP-binding protein [Anaerolineaceae bacterium]